LVALLYCGYFRLENTLNFIKIDCEVTSIGEGYVIFRVDCNIPIIYVICKDTGDSTGVVVEGKFCL